MEAALEGHTGPVVAVGGDGTIRSVIQALIGRKNPLLILPGGSANNIARSLGLTDWDLPQLVAGYQDPIRRHIDIGRITFPWGEEVHFVEGAGFGLFADAMATYDPSQGKSFARGLQTAFEKLADETSYRAKMTIDDEHIDAEYRLVEILNTDSVGPRLPFSPEARLTDGTLHVVFVNSEVPVSNALVALLARRLSSLDGVETREGRNITIAWDGFKLHVDGYIFPDEQTTRALSKNPPKDNTIQIKLIPKGLNLWIPQPEAE